MFKSDVVILDVFAVKPLLITTDILENIHFDLLLGNVLSHHKPFSQINLILLGDKTAQVAVGKRNKVFQIPWFQCIYHLFGQRKGGNHENIIKEAAYLTAHVVPSGFLNFSCFSNSFAVLGGGIGFGFVVVLSALPDVLSGSLGIVSPVRDVDTLKVFGVEHPFLEFTRGKP